MNYYPIQETLFLYLSYSITSTTNHWSVNTISHSLLPKPQIRWRIPMSVFVCHLSWTQWSKLTELRRELNVCGQRTRRQYLTIRGVVCGWWHNAIITLIGSLWHKHGRSSVHLLLRVNIRWLQESSGGRTQGRVGGLQRRLTVHRSTPGRHCCCRDCNCSGRGLWVGEWRWHWRLLLLLNQLVLLGIRRQLTLVMSTTSSCTTPATTPSTVVCGSRCPRRTLIATTQYGLWLLLHLRILRVAGHQRHHCVLGWLLLWDV